MPFSAPPFRLLVFLLFIVNICLLVLFGALRQPSTGLGQRSVDAEGRVLIQLDGRMVHLVALARPKAGSADISPVPDEEAMIRLEAEDFIEEPDMLADYEAFNRFMERQGVLSGLLAGTSVVAVVRDLAEPAAAPRAILQPVARTRSLASLPMAFWIQLGAGFLTLTIGAFFLALRPAHPPVFAFAMAGLGVAGAAFSAAIYSTRPLGLDPAFFFALSVVNQASTFLFGVATIYLFAIYPTVVLRPARLWPVPVLSLACLVLYRMQWAPHDLVSAQTVVVVMMAAIIALVVAQFRATRRDPAGRAVLLWLGISVIIGSGAFVAFVALPVALGFDVLMTQSVAFVPLAAIYVGTALAIARFRLFDLGLWAYRVLLYTVLIILLFVCDAALVMLPRVTHPTSLAIAVGVAGVAYLPLRDLFFERLARGRAPDLADLYRRTASVGLQPGAAQRAGAWAETLKAALRPMTVERLEHAPALTEPAIFDEGERIVVPAFADVPAMALRFADGGRRLFSRRDAALAGELTRLVEATVADRLSYERGVEEERQRIARDLHDEVGATLLSGLHAPDAERRHECIVDALADIRQIASGLAGRDVTLSRLIAQMRHETRMRAEMHGFELSWPLDAEADESDIALPYRLYRNFHAIHREAISNALAHGVAGVIEVRSRLSGDRLTHSVANAHVPGAAQTREKAMRHHGAANMQARARELGGTLTMETAGDVHAVRLEFLVREQTV